MIRSLSAFGFLSTFSLLLFSSAFAASPVISFTQDVDAGPTSSDVIEISATDTDTDITALDYGFSPDAVCDAGDSFPNLFTHATPFAITTEANNGSYVCVRVTDTSSGLSYLLSGNVLNIDTTAPVFSSLNLEAEDSSDVDKIINGDGSYYVRAGEKILFTTNFTAADTIGAGSHINFTIGGVAKQTVDYLPSATPLLARSRRYTILPGEEGAFALVSDTVVDQVGNAMTGFLTVLAAPIVVDTTLPVITVTDGLSATPVTSDDVILTVTDTNADATTYEYMWSATATTDLDCASETYGTSFTSGVAFTISDESNNSNALCVKAEDKAGNELFLNLGTPKIDVTAPVFSNIGVTSDNAFDPSYGNATSTLTFTLTLSAADSFAGPGAGTGQITFDIGTTTGLTVDLIEAASATPGSVYTATYALAGENGAINISAIDFEDFVNQTMTGFAAGAPTPTVIIDTTAPTLDSASRATSNGNPAWAKNNDTITYTLGFDEFVKRSALGSASTAANVTTLTQEFDLPVFGTSDNIIFTVVTGDNGTVSITNADFTIVDRAGNPTTVAAGDINALMMGVLQSDTTKPTITLATISSNNVLDTTLAKTNDTIRVDFTASDNLSPTVSPAGTRKLLGKNFTGSSVGAVGPSYFERFTNGTENSERVVPFKFKIKDEAGNVSNKKNSTDDGSKVTFDRTDPVVDNVTISATSQDLTAYLGDVPTYYARMGDTIDFQFDLCDYVDSESNPPTGTFFGTAVTMIDGGLIGGACTTGDGNPSTFRRWTHQVLGADGMEGTVTFSIDAKDNAGNVFMSVTGTTDGSAVIFDKTLPTSPTTILDLAGPETAQFKHRRNASYSWSGHVDPNTAGADLISDLLDFDVVFDHPSNGTNEVANIPVATTTFTPTLPIPSDDPYTFHIVANDKAGNISSPEKAYTQLYTIGLNGVVRGADGLPLDRAIVQAVAEFGDTCLVGTEVCTAITDIDGTFEILLRPQRDYTVSTWERRHYMDKTVVHIELDDVTRNVQLVGITDPHQIQTGDQTVVVQTDHSFIAADGEPDTTLLFVSSLSGEISTTPISGGFEITSRSRITSVTSNNPNVQITQSNNVFTIKGAGMFTSTRGFDGSSAVNAGPTHSTTGIRNRFGSGNSRLGVGGGIVGNGKSGLRQPGMTRDEFRAMMQRGNMTYAESMAHAMRMNEGRPAKILHYVNDNGYRVFRGYLPGKLAMDQVGTRYTNHIAYRGGPIRNFTDLNIPEEGGIASDTTSFQERYKALTAQYKDRTSTPKTTPIAQAGIRKQDTPARKYATLMNAREQRVAYNQSYKYRPTHKSYRAPSRMKHKDVNNFKVVINGKKVGVGRMLDR